MIQSNIKFWHCRFGLPSSLTDSDWLNRHRRGKRRRGTAVDSSGQRRTAADNGASPPSGGGGVASCRPRPPPPRCAVPGGGGGGGRKRETSHIGSLRLLSSMYPCTAARLSGFFQKSPTTLCFNNTDLTARSKASNIAPPLSSSKEGEASLQGRVPLRRPRRRWRRRGGGGRQRQPRRSRRRQFVGGGRQWCG